VIQTASTVTLYTEYYIGTDGRMIPKRNENRIGRKWSWWNRDYVPAFTRVASVRTESVLVEIRTQHHPNDLAP
jgi:hypothetical protein